MSGRAPPMRVLKNPLMLPATRAESPKRPKPPPGPELSRLSTLPVTLRHDESAVDDAEVALAVASRPRAARGGATPRRTHSHPVGGAADVTATTPIKFPQPPPPNTPFILNMEIDPAWSIPPGSHVKISVFRGGRVA